MMDFFRCFLLYLNKRCQHHVVRFMLMELKQKDRQMRRLLLSMVPIRVWLVLPCGCPNIRWK